MIAAHNLKDAAETHERLLKIRAMLKGLRQRPKSMTSDLRAGRISWRRPVEGTAGVLDELSISLGVLDMILTSEENDAERTLAALGVEL